MNEDDRSELVSARGSVDAARQSVDELVRRIDRRSRRRTGGVVAFVLLVAATFGGYWHWQNVADCKRGNDTRAVLRDLTRDANTESGEALIDVFPGAPPERVAQYRERLADRLTVVVSQLKDRDC